MGQFHSYHPHKYDSKEHIIIASLATGSNQKLLKANLSVFVLQQLTVTYL